MKMFRNTAIVLLMLSSAIIRNLRGKMLMKRIPDETCASICGLFCGACPAFPNECHGCFSDYVREGCKGCKSEFHNGLKKK